MAKNTKGTSTKKAAAAPPQLPDPEIQEQLDNIVVVGNGYARLNDRANSTVRLDDVWGVGENGDGAVVLLFEKGTMVLWPRIGETRPGHEDEARYEAMYDLMRTVSNLLLDNDVSSAAPVMRDEYS